MLAKRILCKGSGAIMKLCDECGLHPANIHLTQIIDNESQSFHLCEECAEKRGIHIAIDDEAASVDAQIAPEEESEDIECPACEMKLSDFKNKGRLGCSSCYQSFENEIEELLINVHGSSLHKGKKYHPSEVAPKESKKEDLTQLKNKLDAAIKNEEFERAALIRDAIHGLNDAEEK
jgi:protein arginine kinase activator